MKFKHNMRIEVICIRHVWEWNLEEDKYNHLFAVSFQNCYFQQRALFASKKSTSDIATKRLALVNLANTPA
eukprot:3288828-Amphidinium_carterae.1